MQVNYFHASQAIQPTADAFVKADMESKNPMTKAMQKEDVLKEAAEDSYKQTLIKEKRADV